MTTITGIRAKRLKRGLANLKVQGIRTTAELDAWIAARPCRDRNGPFLMSRADALNRLTSADVADEILADLAAR